MFYIQRSLLKSAVSGAFLQNVPRTGGAMIKGAVTHWGLVKNFVYRDFKARFAGSILGITWNILHPLVMILIYVIIFSQVMRAKLPGLPSKYGYSVYLCAAIIPWGMFMETFQRYTNLFFEHANLIKKVSFPREILHVSALITASINFLISFTIFMFFLALLHVTGSHHVEITLYRMLLLFVVLVMQQVFSLGLGLAFSVLNVFFRDVGQLVNIATQLWFWFTPIVYPISVVPERLKGFFLLNPLYYFMKIYRAILYQNQAPQGNTLIIAAAVSIATFGIGLVIYKRLVDDVPDEI